MVSFSVERPFEGSAAEAWDVLLDIGTHAGSVPGVESISASARREDGWSAEWVLRMRGSRLQWTEEATVDHEQRAVRFRMTDGDPHDVHGQWRLIADGPATLVRLDMEFEFGIPTIAAVLDPVFQRTMTAVVDHIAAPPALSLADALVTAVRRVVPPDVEVELSTPLDQTTLDSLGLLEAMVHLEELTHMGFTEDTVRAVALEPDYDPAMSVAELAELLARHDRRTASDR